MCSVLLCFDDKVVGVIPVGQQVSGILVVHADVVIREHPWEEVVNLSGNVQNVANSATMETTHQILSVSQMATFTHETNTLSFG